MHNKKQNPFSSITEKLQFKFTSYSLYNVVHATMTKPSCTHFRWKNTTLSKENKNAYNIEIPDLY